MPHNEDECFDLPPEVDRFATAILLSFFCFRKRPHWWLPESGSMEQQTTGNVMQADRFWDLIGRTTRHQGDQDAQMEALRYELRKLPAEEIEAFERAFREQQRRTACRAPNQISLHRGAMSPQKKSGQKC